MKKKNNKGFTLIELLAVIVILAVLVLVALPAVTSLMNKSRKGAFRTEALYFGQDAISTAYNTLLMSWSSSKNDADGKNNGTIWHLDDGGDYLCMGIKDLVEGGYSNKQNYESYGGFVQLYIGTDGTTQTVLNLTNGKYFINSTVQSLASLPDVDIGITDVRGSGTGDNAIIVDNTYDESGTSTGTVGATVKNYNCPKVSTSSKIATLSKYFVDPNASSGTSTSTSTSTSTPSGLE